MEAAPAAAAAAAATLWRCSLTIQHCMARGVSCAQGQVRWAMAGRNEEKLRQIKAELTKIDPAVEVRALHLCPCLTARAAVHTAAAAPHKQRRSTHACCQAVPLVIADADDASSLSKLAADTHVIIATAGPFAKYGSKVVAAAVEAGTHYCDITGERDDAAAARSAAGAAAQCSSRRAATALAQLRAAHAAHARAHPSAPQASCCGLSA